MATKEDRRRKPKAAPTPPAPKPWDPPPIPVKGDPDIETVYAAIGTALSAWEGLEEQLANIFAALVAPDGIQLPAQRAYGSILTFRGRGELITAAAGAVFFLFPNTGLRTSIKNLLDEASQFAARRNEIAHGKVVPFYVPQSGLFGLPMTHHARRAGYVLQPSGYATNKRELQPGRLIIEEARQTPKYAYSSVELLALQKHFSRLANRASPLPLKILHHQHRARGS